MRIKYRYLTWDRNPQEITKIKQVLDSYSLPYSYKEDLTCVIPTFKYELEFFLYEDIAFFDKIYSELKPFDILQNISAEYDKIDMENAECYEIYTGQ